MKPGNASTRIFPEWRFVLAAARLYHSSAIRILVQKLVADHRLDWTAVTRVAVEHDVAPLVFSALKPLSIADSVPSEARATLANAYYGNAIRNQLLFGELTTVLNTIRRTGIAVIVLKGAALADAVYRDRALRPMSDVDLLVRKADVPAVESLLREMGYELNAQQESNREWYWKSDYHFAFRRKLNGMMSACMEVHWQLEAGSGSSKLDIDGIWDRAATAKIPVFRRGFCVSKICSSTSACTRASTA